MYNTNKIVIIGGGSAGWMSAATLINYFPNRDITLIESPNVPIMGVGESTLGYIKFWMNSLGIDEKDFFKYTDASYKLSIKFTDFYKKDYGSFHYPFGSPIETSELGINSWQYKKYYYPETDPEDYCDSNYPWMPCIRQNKIPIDDGRFGEFKMDWCSAYHFDAVKFANWLRENYCKPKGVKHIVSEIRNVEIDENGIKELILDDGSKVVSDLYIDCTGWKSLLLGNALKEPFDSYSDIIPNNRAWATQIPYLDKEKELEPYTNCTAISNGWVWNIPLWSRIGTGYVYSDKFISKEGALEEFKTHLNSNKMTVSDKKRNLDDLKFKDIEMRIGIHERTWVKNVIAIGLSAGFIEPLESNGLYTVHEFLNKLVETIGRERVNQWDLDGYNYATKKMYDYFAKFVSLHYLLSQRDDSEYWIDVSKRSVSHRMEEFLNDSFSELLNSKYISHQHNKSGGLHCISAGLNYPIVSPYTIKNSIFYNYNDGHKKLVDSLMEVWKNNKSYGEKLTKDCLSVYEYINQNFYC